MSNKSNKVLVKRLYELREEIYDIFCTLNERGYRCLINMDLPQDSDSYNVDDLIVDAIEIDDLTETFRED